MLSKNKKILYIVLVVGIVLLLNLAGGSFIKNLFYTCFSPAQKLLYRAGDGCSNIFDGLFTATSLKKTNQELIKQNILLKQTLSQMESYEKENTVLKQALNFNEEQGFQFILADVISIAPEQDTVLISIGSANGACKDMPVVTENGVLVGKVVQVLEHFSNVLLISSEKIVFDIEIQSKVTDSILAAAKGEGQSKMSFILAPQDAVIEQGDIIKTAALGGKFPKGLLVGEVNSFRKNDAESFQEGIITPYFTKISFERLFLITNFNALTLPYDG